MVLVTLFIGWFILHHTFIEIYFKTIGIDSVFFIKYSTLHKKVLLFSAISELKPLLHTWSLAVEEQFYIIFPIFLLMMEFW